MPDSSLLALDAAQGVLGWHSKTSLLAALPAAWLSPAAFLCLSSHPPAPRQHGSPTMLPTGTPWASWERRLRAFAPAGSSSFRR